MPKIPKPLIEIFEKLEEDKIAFVCDKLKVKPPSGTSCKSFLLSKFEAGNLNDLKNMYSSMEGALFVLGCAPGVGIVFNIIDACFCYLLGNWIGAFVGIVSCFPIPGFKVVGKGVGSVLSGIVKSISPLELQKFTHLLGERLIKLGYHSDGKVYAVIREELEELLPDVKNIFDSKMTRLSDIIKHYTINPETLTKKIEETTYSITNHSINDYHISQNTLLSLTSKVK